MHVGWSCKGLSSSGSQVQSLHGLEDELETSLGNSVRPCLKIKSKEKLYITSVVEHLLSIREALGSTFIIAVAATETEFETRLQQA